jgi:hypothetical protein
MEGFIRFLLGSLEAKSKCALEGWKEGLLLYRTREKFYNKIHLYGIHTLHNIEKQRKFLEQQGANESRGRVRGK